MEPGARLTRDVLLPFIALIVWLAMTAGAAAQPEPGPSKDAAPWKRRLNPEQEKQVESLRKSIQQLRSAGKFAEAIEPAMQALTLCQKACGPDHWQTADARWTVHDLRKVASFPEEGRNAMAAAGELLRKAIAASDLARFAESERLDRTLLEVHRRWLGEYHPDTALSYRRLGNALYGQGKFAEAEKLYRKALAIKLKVLGENHPETATDYNDIGYNLDEQGKHVEAELLDRRALANFVRILGEDHPYTAASYDYLAANLNFQGKFAEAEPFFRKALAINLKLQTEDHPHTSIGYNNLAVNLLQQGRYTEAEALFRKALSLKLKLLGEDHPESATNYNNIAGILDRQGKYTEAEPLRRKALAILLKQVGEEHPLTARSYDGVAFNLKRQGKYAEAEPLFRKALAIRRKAQGEDHPDTASCYINLAGDLRTQGKYAEAERLHRKALAILLKALGEGHPETAAGYASLANDLDAQGKCTEAEAPYRKALAIRKKTLGEGHPFTATSCDGLAQNLDLQGKLGEAVSYWRAAASMYERSRGAQGVSGLERSLTAGSSPLPALAIALARQGQPRAAWSAWESGLARGLLDDLSARLLRPLTPDQRRREADLTGQLQRLDVRLARLIAKARRTEAEDKQLDALRDAQSALRGQWVEHQNALDHQYQAYAGKPSTLEEVQAVLPADAALVGWLDVKNRHWACVVRHAGDPTWVQIPGSGPDAAWTKEDDDRLEKLRDALASRQSEWIARTEQVSQQQVGPLTPYLREVKHLIVLPSGAQTTASIEALVAVLPVKTPRPIVSYAPSGSMFARLSAPRSQSPGPLRILAVGDPAFPKPAPNRPAPTPPDHGLAIVAIDSNGTADLFGIKAGDVLLEYNGKALNSVVDLAVVHAGDKAIRVPVKLWRDGEVRSLDIAAGQLGIEFDAERPAGPVVVAQRAAVEVLRPSYRSDDFAPLPGTRREVQAIAALFPEGRVTTLLGSQATVSTVQGLARSGALKGYRFIHLATHGKANPNVALSSALYLAAEPERSAATTDPAALKAAPDGRLTAEEIVRTWDLDADLVVLSACESGLGRYAGGEGYLGFAQALFVKGARSLVLSQWRVDDRATSLLMTRFYHNLLGNRPGLSKPQLKSEALHDAKEWLRTLTHQQASSELDALERGAPRPLVDASGSPAPDARTTSQPADDHPYAHPYYWAAFILIGDPN